MTPEQKKEQVIASFRKIAKKYKTRNSSISIKEYGPSGCPVECKKNNIYIKKLAESIKAETGKTEYSGSPGASDCRFFAKKNIPATCFGVAGGNMHAPGEWVDLASFKKYTRILKNFISRIK